MRISDWSSDVCSSDLQEGPEWTWFENGLSYDNARLPQALIVTGAAALSATMVEAGLRSLRWLVAMQTAPEGHFRPVGSHGFLMTSRNSRSEEHTSELQSLMRISYAVFCLKKKKK